MNKQSKKHAALQRRIRDIAQQLPRNCMICGSPANDPAHLLPRSLYPEHAGNADNIVPLCRECHQQHDDNIEFRTRQTKLFNQACKVNEAGAKRYYRR